MNNTEENIIDLFSNEVNKKKKKEQKKIEKFKKKEEKKKAKEEKRLAKIEDKAFALKQKKEDEMNKKNNNPSNRSYETPSTVQFLGDAILGLFSILVILSSIGYNIYEYFNDSLDIIYGSLLLFTSISFVLSMVIKKEGIKKFFYILSSISLTLFVGYQLFI